jgi:hypothetical protein
MSTVVRSPRRMRKLAVLACVAGILGSSLMGCFGGAGAGSLSPEEQAKGKAAFKKRSENYGVKAAKKTR